MIRKNHLFCNLIRIKNSSNILIRNFMMSFDPHKEVCPICGRTGDCVPFASYDRYIIDFVYGSPVTSTIKISRIKCSCGHTHAILPDPLIPYDQYSLFFILRVLMEHQLRLHTVSELCDRFGISVSTLYRWKALFDEHCREWLGLLTFMEQSRSSSLKKLIRLDPYSDFAAFFFRKTGLSFMQSHKNPSHSPRSMLPPDHV